MRAYSLALAKGTPAPAGIPDRRPARARSPAPRTKTIGTAAGGGTVATGVGFWDWVATHPVLSTLIVLAVVAAVGVGIHLLTRRRSAAQHAPVPDTPVVPAIAPEPAA